MEVKFYDSVDDGLLIEEYLKRRSKEGYSLFSRANPDFE